MGVKQRVNAGARALDALVPDWRNRMPADLTSINTILPAVFGSKDDAISKLTSYLGDELKLFKLGFETSPKSHNVHDEAKGLCAAWAHIVAPP